MCAQPGGSEVLSFGAKGRRGVGAYVDTGIERDRGLECSIEDRDHRRVACHVYAQDLREEEEPVGADDLGLSVTEWKKKKGARGGCWVFARAFWAEAKGLAHLGAGLARAKYGLF